MNFTLLPDLAPFAVAFFAVALVAVLGVVAVAGVFFAEHRPVRVRRHESVVHYYGQLAFGH